MFQVETASVFLHKFVDATLLKLSTNRIMPKRRSVDTIEGRCFRNPFIASPDKQDAETIPMLRDQDLENLVEHYRGIIAKNAGIANCDESVYTGGPGVAYAFLRILDTNQTAAFLRRPPGGGSSRSSQNLTPWYEKTRNTRHRDLPTSLLCGHAGVSFVELILAWLCSDFDAAQQWLEEYLRIRTADCASDEWLYGKVGYLFGLLYIRKRVLRIANEQDAGHSSGASSKSLLIEVAADKNAAAYQAQLRSQYEQNHSQTFSSTRKQPTVYSNRGATANNIDENTRAMQARFENAIDAKIIEVANQIVESGRATSQRRKDRQPALMYYWYDEPYLGAAHGLCGIFYFLLCCRLESRSLLPDAALEDVRQGIEWLVQMCRNRNSGNYSAVEGERDEDHLVHFCHGAPGFVFLFCKAHEVFTPGDASNSDLRSHLQI